MRRQQPRIYEGQCWGHDDMCGATDRRRMPARRHRWSGNARVHCDVCERCRDNSQWKGTLQQLRHDGRAGYLDEYDVVETDTVERVQEGETTLNLVRLDHALQDVTDRQWLALPREMVCDSEDGAKVVRWVSPYNMHSVRQKTHERGGRARRKTHILQRGNNH